MYPEFVVMYVGLLIVFIVTVVNLVFTVKLLKKLSGGANASVGVNQSSGAVFCKKCATEFDASLRVCPNCGTTR